MQVIAPCTTTHGDLWATVADYALIVYPFVEGQNAVDAGMTDAQWQAFGAALRQIHSLDLPPELARQLAREQWPVRSLSFVGTLRERIASNSYHNDHEAELAAFWSARARDFSEIERRLDHIGHLLPNKGELQHELVLCHADIHRYNILIGTDSTLTIVDWDEVMLAPKERDLTFIGGGIDGPPDAAQTMQFYVGYGAAAINPLLITYYRYDWLMQDLNSFAEWVLLHDDLGEASKAQALRLFKGLFSPGNEVEAAERSYADLPDHMQG
jgi:spectinomycin phosphotransferase